MCFQEGKCAPLAYTHENQQSPPHTGAKFVMVMKGMPIKNICPATNPLNINLSDTKVVKSTTFSRKTDRPQHHCGVPYWNMYPIQGRMYPFASKDSNTSLYASKMLRLSGFAIGFTRIVFVL